MGVTQLYQAKAKPRSTGAGSEPLSTFPRGLILQQEGLAAHTQQHGRMKAVLLPEPSGSGRAPACSCLPVLAP